MVIPRAELQRSIPRYSSHTVDGGKLFVFDQNLHPLGNQRAFVEAFKQQRPTAMDPAGMHGSYLHDGDRADAGLVKHVKIGQDDLVLKRVRYTVNELRRGLHNQSKMERGLHLQASLPIRQLITYYDTVEEARKIVEKRGQKIEDIWPVEVPLAYYQADDGYDWLVFNYIPPSARPRSGTDEVKMYQSAETDPSPLNLLLQAGAGFATDVEYVITDNPGFDDTKDPLDQKISKYRKVLVDTELLLRRSRG